MTNWNVGDIATVSDKYDATLDDFLFYVTSLTNDTASGYLVGSNRTRRNYSCPLSQMSRIARIIKWNENERIGVLTNAF
jgi:hypothetical protein